MSRFKVIEGSLLGHGCCFTATIVDTEGNGQEDYENVICDLVTVEWANTVATLLNNYVSQNNSNIGEAAMTFLSNKERDDILDAIERVNGEEGVRDAMTHMDIIKRGCKSHEEYIIGRDNF